ncbi:hypothetical protein RD792_001325 [Penstemon davidsonii]|uniref:DOG1 domain-containing protein n=1 Tax=Penstemon davidsonii TaxID=160366 RepID=A0ABR0DN43_9LAMI|nr:hypothetical protein RD792_001325 [Penstemon davidsonii]
MINGTAAECDTFHKFFEFWIGEQNQQLQELISASKQHEQSPQPQQGRNTQVETEQQTVEETILHPLLERVIKHYEYYYRAKSKWAKNDVLSMFKPTWRSSLEDAFLWIGGWRPSMAFHLLYSKSGLQFEAKFAELIQGLSTGDLGDLTSSQLNLVNELQREIIREEKELTEKLAKQQERVADPTMVELAHVVTELLMEREVGRVMDEGRVDATLAPKEEGLVEILQRADDLRLKTLKQVLNILTQIQCVHFLIAAAELHLRCHEWGKMRDERNHLHHHGESQSSSFSSEFSTNMVPQSLVN